MTYGKYQEEAARALNDLVLSKSSLNDGGTVLECRRHSIAAIRERLHFLGGASGEPGKLSPRVSAVATRPLQELANVLDGLPETAPGWVAPSDLLPGPPAEAAPTAEDRWRCTARSLTLANHELTTAVARPWVTSNASLWHLTGDVAAVVEALALLDERLGREGLLPRSTGTAETARRLVAGDVARLARWFGVDDAADLAFSSPLTRLGLYGGPRIHMVRRPEDLAVAQRTLAAFLHPRNGDLTPEARLGVRAARVLSVGQIRLAEVFAAWAEREPEGRALAEQFTRRIPAYQALHRSTVRLVEAGPSGSPLVLAQQSEMNGQLRRFRSGVLSRPALLELNAATHSVTVTLGRALRREGIQRKNVLVLRQQDDHGLPRPTAITNRNEPFHVACNALAHDAHPTASGEQWAAPVHRERLRSTLDRQPSTTPPPLRTVHGAVARAGRPGPAR